jgi:hypothetical protein
MTSEEENRKRVDQVVDNLRRAEQAQRDKLLGLETRLATIEAHLNGMQHGSITQTLHLERIYEAVVKLGRGLGVYVGTEITASPPDQRRRKWWHLHG